MTGVLFNQYVAWSSQQIDDRFCTFSLTFYSSQLQMTLCWTAASVNIISNNRIMVNTSNHVVPHRTVTESYKMIQQINKHYNVGSSLTITGDSISSSQNVSVFSLNQEVLPSASMSSAQRLICKQRAVLISGTDVKHQGASDPSGLRQ